MLTNWNSTPDTYNHDEAMGRDKDGPDRADLKKFQADMIAWIPALVHLEYEYRGFENIAPLDIQCIADHMHDAMSDATFAAYVELEE